jgi:hypothetical protein
VIRYGAKQALNFAGMSINNLLSWQLSYVTNFIWMRRLIAVIFLLLTIVTTETGVQLLKLPMLITHFTTHLSEGRSSSLAGFLEEHYSGGRHNDKDSQQDQQLPFKTVNVESFSSLYVPAISPVLAQNSFSSSQPQLSSAYCFTLQDHFAGIFHPPRGNQYI